MNAARRRASPAFLLASTSSLIAVLFGCGLFIYRRPSGFSHGIHQTRGITCDACHYGFDTEATAGMPTYGSCLPCHGPADFRESYPFEKEIQAHDPELGFEAAPRVFDLKFSHATHRQEGLQLDCSECHVELDSVLRSSRTRGPRPETCRECHREHGVAFECSLCHETLRRDVMPPSHAGSTWRRNHGQLVALGQTHGHEEDCFLCHSQSDCDSCHRIEKPMDHTEFFRIRGHGLQVSIRRERCMACHRESFCVRCHQETVPRSHNASWGGRQSNHCLSCHESLGETGCSVCHAAAPSHQQATPIPPPPHPRATSDCRRCHLRPPHADNGLDCTFCHR